MNDKDVPPILGEVWSKMQGNPENLEGLTYGEVDDFFAAVLKTLGETEQFFRYAPMPLVKRMLSFTEDKGLDETMELMREMLRLPEFRKRLNEIAGMADE